MDKKHFQLLIQCVLSLQSEEEALAFFEDMCTVKEMEDMEHRLEIAVALLHGETFTEVQHDTGASSTTVSRVSRCLKYGEGYRKILERLDL